MNKLFLTIVLLFTISITNATIKTTIVQSNTINKIQKIASKKDIRTDTIHVDGNCNMCKSRIEDAALIKGVKKATWDKYKDQLIVIYDADKTTLLTIEKSIAKVGHDTPNCKADDKVYSKLPKCCLYREGGAHTH